MAFFKQHWGLLFRKHKSTVSWFKELVSQFFETSSKAFMLYLQKCTLWASLLWISKVLLPLWICPLLWTHSCTCTMTGDMCCWEAGGELWLKCMWSRWTKIQMDPCKLFSGLPVFCKNKPKNPETTPVLSRSWFIFVQSFWFLCIYWNYILLQTLNFVENSEATSPINVHGKAFWLNEVKYILITIYLASQYELWKIQQFVSSKNDCKK